MADTESAQILLDFIVDEEQALQRKLQGEFYPSNWNRIKPLLPKISRLLPAEEQTRFYFHYLRVVELPKVSASDFAILTAAYRALFPYLDFPYPASTLSRLNATFAFGFDDKGILPSGASTGAEYESYRKVLVQCASYSRLPTMLKKKDKLEVHAPSFANRVIEALRHVDYLHKGPPQSMNDEYYSMDLQFWGLCTIALLNEQTAVKLIDDLTDMRRPLPARHKYLERLEFCLDEIGLPALKQQFRARV